jgi:hypothetical protein
MKVDLSDPQQVEALFQYAIMRYWTWPALVRLGIFVLGALAWLPLLLLETIYDTAKALVKGYCGIRLRLWEAPHFMGRMIWHGLRSMARQGRRAWRGLPTISDPHGIAQAAQAKR